MSDERRDRRERLVGMLLPFYFKRFHSTGRDDEQAALARADAFKMADRLMHECDERERQGQ